MFITQRFIDQLPKCLDKVSQEARIPFDRPKMMCDTEMFLEECQEFFSIVQKAFPELELYFELSTYCLVVKVTKDFDMKRLYKIDDEVRAATCMEDFINLENGVFCEVLPENHEHFQPETDLSQVNVFLNIIKKRMELYHPHNSFRHVKKIEYCGEFSDYGGVTSYGYYVHF